MTYKDSYGNIWYYRLKHSPDKRGLFGTVPRSSIVNGQKFLIQLKTNKEDEFLYTYFNNYVEFYRYQIKIKPENRCFFETILGETQQKLYFDIDINLDENPGVDSDAVKDDLIRSTLITLDEFGIPYEIQKNILVCTSHGCDEYNKKSYHIIVDGYTVPNCQHEEAFYNIIKSKMNPEYSKYLDHLYKSTQQFRILGSQKRNSGRVKIFEESWSFFGHSIKYEYPDDLTGEKYLHQLDKTLITNCRSCIELPHVRIHEVALKVGAWQRKAKFTSNILKISLNLANLAINKLAECAGMTMHDPRFPYKLKSIEGNMILLKREKASLCRVCEVIHEKEHPFLIINNNSDIKFDCRRSTNHGDGRHRTLLVGNLGVPLTPNHHEREEIEAVEDYDSECDEDGVVYTLDLNSMNPLAITAPEDRTSVASENGTSKPMSESISETGTSESISKTGTSKRISKTCKNKKLTYDIKSYQRNTMYPVQSIIQTKLEQISKMKKLK